MDDLDDGHVGVVVADDEQAGVDEVGEHAGGAGQLLELAARRGDAGAVAGDEAGEQRAHDVLIATRERVVDLIGVGRQRAGDAAEREVAIARDAMRGAIARVPQLRGGEAE